jgi:pimeloyl-ACP methyl ester carboxylesterase
VREADLELPEGRTLRYYDASPGASEGSLTVVWHHGTPNIGPPPEPLFSAAERLGIRWVGYDRPGYGGSTPVPSRNVASAALDVASVADALHVDRFAVMGHSGGGPHALACGALLSDRLLGVVSGSALAPYDAERLDWFAGMAPAAAAELRAAAEGREAMEQYLETARFDPQVFTPEDHATLEGPWSWLLSVVGPAMQGGTAGMMDDDLAYVAPWGFEPGQVAAPVLLLHGGRDRIVPSSHGDWLSSHIPKAELWIRPHDGHVSVLSAAEAAMEWLRQQADQR